MYVYCIFHHVVDEIQETDEDDETDSVEQPRITSTALKMQMTLRSMIDLGMNVSLIIC